MTVIRPNSISGITSITSHQNDVAFYKSDGTGANINNISINTAGIITANTFYGDGSNLTGVSALSLANGANNRVVTATGAAALTGEANLTFDGTSVFELQPSSATPARFIGDANRTGQGQHLSQFEGNWNGTLVGRMVVVAGEDTSNKDDGHLDFFTTSSGGSNERRLRIDSKGQLSSSGSTAAFDGTSSINGLQMYYETDNGIASFGSYSSGGNTDLAFYTNAGGGAATEKLRIKSDGNVGINEQSPSAPLHVENDKTNASTYYLNGDAAILVQNKNSNANAKTVVKLEGPAGGGDCALVYGSGSGTNMIFADRQHERLRITSDGYLQQHKLIAVSYSDSRSISLTNTDLTTSNFYNTTFFASDSTILDSNGHFVAPVHGIYRLYFRCTTDGVSGNRANVRLRKNGNTINEAYGSNNGSTNQMSVSSEIVMELNAGEYLDIQIGQLHTMSGSQHKQVTFHMLG